MEASGEGVKNVLDCFHLGPFRGRDVLKSVAHVLRLDFRAGRPSLPRVFEP